MQKSNPIDVKEEILISNIKNEVNDCYRENAVFYSPPPLQYPHFKHFQPSMMPFYIFLQNLYRTCFHNLVLNYKLKYSLFFNQNFFSSFSHFFKPEFNLIQQMKVAQMYRFMKKAFLLKTAENESKACVGTHGVETFLEKIDSETQRKCCHSREELSNSASDIFETIGELCHESCCSNGQGGKLHKSNIHQINRGLKDINQIFKIRASNHGRVSLKLLLK